MAPPQGPAQPWTFHNGRAGSWAERGRPGRRAAGQALRYGTPWRLGCSGQWSGPGPAGRLVRGLWAVVETLGQGRPDPSQSQAKASLSSQSCSAYLGRTKKEEGTSLCPNLRDEREKLRVPEASQHPY